MVVKSLKPLFILFFKIVLFFCIRTNTFFLYSYWSPVSVHFPVLCYTTVDICCAITWHVITWHL